MKPHRLHREAEEEYASGHLLMSLALPFQTLPGVSTVASFAELATTPLAGGINALCWPRALPGGYEEIVRLLGPGEGIETIDEARLRALPASPTARAALEFMLEDWHLLAGRGLAPALNHIHAYPRDEDDAVVATDVFSFHADSAPFEADTYLCTYYGPPSEGLCIGDAVRRVDDPATRAGLLDLYGDADDAGFVEFLRDQCYDLHYAAAPGARPYSFGAGHLWRIATDWPGCPVPPCVHRAPATGPGQSRLLLIS